METDKELKRKFARDVSLPQLVLQVDDLPLLGLVLGDQVLQLSLDLSPLGLLTRNLLLGLVQCSLQRLQPVVDLSKMTVMKCGEAEQVETV